MSEQLPEWLEIPLKELYEEEIQEILKAVTEAHISGDVAAHTILKVNTNFDLVHKEALNYLKGYKTQLVTRGGSTCTVPVLDSAGNITGYKQEFITWMKDYHENQRRELADALKNMIKEGKSIKNGAKDVNHIFDKYKGHAESVMQTESRKANTAGALNRYKKEAGITKWEWSTAGSDVCPHCMALQGQIFDEKEKGHQPRPPLHNRCRCRVLPVIDWDSFEAIEE